MITQQLIGLTLIPASLIGVICNWLVVIATWKSRSLSHSFSLLTANQAVFNGLHSTLILFYATPMIVFDSKFLLARSEHCGFLLILCYDASIQAHFLITINRFTAVFMPMVYKKVFNAKWTKVIILASFLLSLSVLTYFFQILPCRVLYFYDLWIFTYNDYPICYQFAIYGDTMKCCGLAVFNVVVDMITISKVRRTRKLIRRGQPPVAAFQKKEIDFLKQSFGQSLYVLLYASTYYIAPMYTDSKVAAFMFCNVFWCLLHSFDGALTLLFNSEIRKALQSQKPKHQVTVNSLVVTDGKPSVKM